MRELTYKNILESELGNLDEWKFSIYQIQSELDTLNAEYASIKATNYDKMPSGSGENIQEEKLVSVISKKDQKEAELKYTKMRVADLERLLEQLPDDERMVIERKVIKNEKYAIESLAGDLGYESAQIYRIKNRALRRMVKLRHGAAYHE